MMCTLNQYLVQVLATGPFIIWGVACYDDEDDKAAPRSSVKAQEPIRTVLHS